MGALTNVFRRYYFRHRLRSPDGDSFGICLGLRTRRLDEARRRATHLAAYCNKLRLRPVMLMSRQTLTPAQKREIFCRQLSLERNALDALHGAVIALPNDDILPQRHSEEFPFQLAAMEHVCREWIAHGWPDPTEYADLENYIEAVFAGRLDELERAYLLGGLGSLEFLVTLRRHRRAADTVVGAEIDAPQPLQLPGETPAEPSAACAVSSDTGE